MVDGIRIVCLAFLLILISQKVEAYGPNQGQMSIMAFEFSMESAPGHKNNDRVANHWPCRYLAYGKSVSNTSAFSSWFLSDTRLLTCQSSRHLPLMSCSLKPCLVMKYHYNFLLSNPILLPSQSHLLPKTLKQYEHTCYHTISWHEALNWHWFYNHMIHALPFWVLYLKQVDIFSSDWFRIQLL